MDYMDEPGYFCGELQMWIKLIDGEEYIAVPIIPDTYNPRHWVHVNSGYGRAHIAQFAPKDN